MSRVFSTVTNAAAATILAFFSVLKAGFQPIELNLSATFSSSGLSPHLAFSLAIAS